MFMQGADNSSVYVLDLGSGKGGAARWLASKFGCHVTCFNLGERQNALNMERAQAAGIGHLIDSYLGSFNEPLPIEWTDRFDMVWSQEAFCHCVDHAALLAEVQRVLKPGGTLVFSDIMQGDAGGDCSSFTGQNVVTRLATPQMYKVRPLHSTRTHTLRGEPALHPAVAQDQCKASVSQLTMYALKKNEVKKMK
jgi:cyclopropane fatty-acyl-phospholipid synthase-like methyltransferase